MSSHKKFLSKTTFAGVFGNTLEWYDFVLYGSLAPFIAHHFFPVKNHFTSLILTFAVFAVGFLMRPLGGILFGLFGDSHGRKQALIWSVFLMVIPTILIGLVPSYHTIGLWAPMIIILIRLFQGLAVGGELTGSITYLSEFSDKKNRGYFSSYAMLGVFAGIIIGPIVIKIVHLCLHTNAQFAAWGWRIPFLFGAVLGFIVYLLRRNIHESDAFLQYLTKRKDKGHSALLECVSHQKIPLLIGCGLSVRVGIPFWLIMVYASTYYTKIMHAPFSTVQTINLVSIVIALIATPIFGWLTKKVSGWLILCVAAIIFIAFSYALNQVIVQHFLHSEFYWAQYFQALMVGVYLAAIPGVLVSLFPTQTRYTGIAISYNVALAIFGGTAPLIVTTLLKNNIMLAPGIVLTGGGIIALIALLFARPYMRY